MIATPLRVSEAPTVEVLRALPTLTVVRLPDGSIGTVQWSSLAEVHVTHHDLVLGRGPWVYDRWRVEPADAGEIQAYRQRCSALAMGGAVVTAPYVTAVNGIDKGARVHHVNVPSIHGTVTVMGAFTATVQYDNGVEMRQSIGVLQEVRS